MRGCKGFRKTPLEVTPQESYLTGLTRHSFSPTCVNCQCKFASCISRHRQILCQVPATVTSKLFSPRIWIGCATIGWGLSSTLMSTGFNMAGLIVARVSLGVFEAGFGPGSASYHFQLSNPNAHLLPPLQFHCTCVCFLQY